MCHAMYLKQTRASQLFTLKAAINFVGVLVYWDMEELVVVLLDPWVILQVIFLAGTCSYIIILLLCARCACPNIRFLKTLKVT